jgi:lipoic acid synthetase
MSKVIGLKEKGADKTARIPIKVIAQEPLKKPAWIRMALPNNARFQAIKKILRENRLHTVCEEYWRVLW